jgi:hypothetical protein
MIACAICVKTICITTVLCYPLISGIISTILFENYEDRFSDCERMLYAIFWPLAIIILPIFYLIKKYKLNVKLKEANKLEEYQCKKETVYTVLRELKLR